MNPIRVIRSRTVVMPASHIDTDQIIPARFLTTTTREGLGAALFADLRYDAAGRPKPGFVLNRPESRGCAILVAGRNIGCGSSREHAPWALFDYGFRAVDEATHASLVENPGAEIEVDLEATCLRLPDGREVHFPVEAFARYCLMHGVDELGYLLGHAEAIAEYERRTA